MHDLSAPQLLGLARLLEVQDHPFPDGITIRKLASALKPIIAKELEVRLIEAVRRWERQGHFGHGREGARLQRSLHQANARNPAKRDRRLEPIERPYAPSGAQDVRRIQ